MDNYGQGLVEGYEHYPPGQYRVMYQRHELISPRGLGGRIILWFAITHGDYAGGEVPFFCTVKIRDRKVGSFSCRKSTKYFKTITALTDRKSQRKDRLPPSLLKGMKLLAEVVDVVKRQDKSEYDHEDKYSKVERLEREL